MKHTHTYTVERKTVAGENWRITNFKNLAGKTLANCNQSSLSSLNEACRAKFKATIIYFIITCGAKMVWRL